MPLKLLRWRTDADLLANSQSGTPLPAGKLEFRQHCGMEAQGFSELAQLDGRVPLLSRAVSDQGAVYFCHSLPLASHSNLVSNGVVFYVMIQRALSRGAGSLGMARQWECGSSASALAADWVPLDDFSKDIRLSRRPLMTGLYSAGDTRIALNRPLTEDLAEVITDEQLQGLFDGLDYVRINEQSGSSSALANEVWRVFLMLMIVALLAEAVLCVPDPQRTSSRSRFADAKQPTRI